MKLLPAYISYNFLEDLAKNSNINLLETYKSNDNKNKAELVQLVLNGLYAKVDKSSEEIASLRKQNNFNPLFEYLLLASGKQKVEYCPAEFNTIKHGKLDSLIINPFTQFFLSNTIGNTEKMEKDYGILIHQMNRKESYKRLSTIQLETFKLRETKDWIFIHKYELPHHSILIADPHLLRNNQNVHVLRLLECLISTNLKSKYHITFFISSNSMKSNEKDKAGILLPERVRWIKDNIEIKFKKLPFEIEYVVYDGEDFHDRFIITNNAMIYSGYGFDLISDRNTVKKQTSWLFVNHGKIVEEKNGTVRTHYDIVRNYLLQLKEWINRKQSYSSIEIKNPLFRI